MTVAEAAAAGLIDLPAGLEWTRLGSWRRRPDGEWAHAPWWKVAINTPLRWLQAGRRWRLLVYTRSTIETDKRLPPAVLGYGFGWIEFEGGRRG